VGAGDAVQCGSHSLWLALVYWKLYHWANFGLEMGAASLPKLSNKMAARLLWGRVGKNGRKSSIRINVFGTTKGLWRHSDAPIRWPFQRPPTGSFAHAPAAKTAV